MRTRRRAWSGVLPVLWLGLGVPAVAQFSEEFGRASDAAASELVRLGYLVGEWRVSSFVRNDSGDFAERPG